MSLHTDTYPFYFNQVQRLGRVQYTAIDHGEASSFQKAAQHHFNKEGVRIRTGIDRDHCGNIIVTVQTKQDN